MTDLGMFFEELNKTGITLPQRDNFCSTAERAALTEGKWKGPIKRQKETSKSPIKPPPKGTP